MFLCATSRFSPPQICMPSSYAPMWWKYSRSMLKRPPAMVGVRTGSERSPCRRSVSRCGTEDGDFEDEDG